MRRVTLGSVKKALALTHKTWLAGIGVYDSGREKAANKFDQLFVDGSALVNDLLEEGELVETQLQAKIEARKMLRDKISALKAKLGFGNEKQEHQIDMLSQRVDNLIEVVAKLAQQQAVENKAPATNIAEKVPAKAAAKPASKSTATKKPAKTATKPAAKATATKAPAKAANKPAAKATATKASAKTATKPTAKATATKASAKTATKPAAKATATKTPAKTATKPAAKTTATKAKATSTTKPVAKAAATEAPDKPASQPNAGEKD